jgi:hypothetical protein
MYRRRVVDAPGTVAMSGYEVYQEETDTWVPNIEITHEEAHELIAYLNSLK